MKIIHQNKKATFDYEIIEEFTAGIMLLGSEIKSVRGGHVNLKGSYVSLQGERAFLKGAHISRYPYDSAPHYEPVRNRELLLHKQEIYKLQSHLNTQGITIVPLAMGLQGKYAKVLIGVARGKKKYDKRETIKKREAKREMDRAVKHYK